ncbi:response regulator transcription factor [Chitinibacter sp. FCG-7]|uniref:Response regulator transcription factor n=1 Tax=Chitinibacter mangrovi TaxID=3153927 RepID=A0AAU7F4H6_9NEIS
MISAALGDAMSANHVIVSPSRELAMRWCPLLTGRGAIELYRQWPSIAQIQQLAPVFCVFDLAAWQRPEQIPDLKLLSSQLAICLVCDSFSVAEELRWLATGIRACCTHDLDDERLKTIIDVTVRGGIWVSSRALPMLMQGLQHFTAEARHTATSAASADNSLAILTPQERKIAQLVGQGESNKLIARALNISDHTVKSHLSAIFSKLHLSDRVHLALLVNQGDVKGHSVDR